MDADSLMKDDVFWQKMNALFAARDYDWITVLTDIEHNAEHSDDVALMYYLRTTYIQEKNGPGQKTILDKVGSLEEVYRRYTALKFYLRRIEYDLMDGDMTPFFEFVASYQVSAQEIMEMMKCCVAQEHMDKVGRRIQGAL